MQRTPQRLSHVTSRSVGEHDPTLPAVLEFQSPSAAIAATPIPPVARGIIWIVGSMLAAWLAALGLIRIDRVITAPGRVVSQAATIVVQPLETAIVRSIEVREGEKVRAGDLLARLDPTFAAADVGALQAQVSVLEAEVSRLQAEAEDRPFQYSGPDPSLSLQALIYTQREAERSSKLESYRQKIDGLKSAAARAAGDATAFGARLAVAQDVEAMRKGLEQLKSGSRLNSLIATDNRLEIERSLSTAVKTEETARADLAAMIAERDAYVQNWHAQTAQTLSEESRKLSDARESLSKARLRRQLVELRADRDATVLTIAKISAGSVLQPSEQLITMVPADAPLEIEADISGRDSGFVRVGDPVAIKFDTFPFSQYGMANGTVRMISPDSLVFSGQQLDRTTGAGAGAVPRNGTPPFYLSRIAIDRVGLHDVPTNFRLVPGMPVTADIKVGRHTVLNYLLGRVLASASEGMREP
jgi:hemolysin D